MTHSRHEYIIQEMEEYDSLPKELRDLAKEYGYVDLSCVGCDIEDVKIYLENLRRNRVKCTYGFDHPEAQQCSKSTTQR